MKNLKYIFLLSCLWLAACTQDNDEWLGEEQTTECTEATVHLNLQCAEISVDTRSTTPQDPETDNPIYHLYLLHYNDEGQLIKDDNQETEWNGDPQLTVKWNPTLRVTSGKVETICLIANMEGHAPAKWPETYAELKDSCATLQFDGTMIKSKKMFMFGSYQGTLKDNQDINIMMGRMATTLKIVVGRSNNYIPYAISKIEIQNVSHQTYFIPHPSTESNFGSNMIEDFSDNIIKIDGSASERIFYYQVGENIDPDENRRTKVVITARKSGDYNEKTYTVVLGADAPGTPNRNYSLYRNNNYTFNINLN